MIGQIERSSIDRLEPLADLCHTAPDVCKEPVSDVMHGYYLLLLAQFVDAQMHCVAGIEKPVR